MIPAGNLCAKKKTGHNMSTSGQDSLISEGSGASFDFYVMSPEEQTQDQFLAPDMDRSRFSGPSTESHHSLGSYSVQSHVESPPSSSWSILSGEGLTRRGSQYESPQNSNLSPETAAPSRESSTGLPLFNIERDGDPRIEWVRYYDFVVTKAEAFYQLQPGYLATDKYPSRVPSENVIT